MYPILEIIKGDEGTCPPERERFQKGARFLAFKDEKNTKENLVVAQATNVKFLMHTGFSRQHKVCEHFRLYARISNSYDLSTLKLGEQLKIGLYAGAKVIGFFPGTFDDWFEYNDLKG